MADWTYDRTLPTDRDRLRLMIPDTDEANPIFFDGELDFLLTDNGDLRLAAATALEIMASQQAMIQKVMTVLDVQTDGAKVSDALLKRAGQLRDDWARTEDETDSGFDFAELVYDDFSWRERMLNELQRGAL